MNWYDTLKRMAKNDGEDFDKIVCTLSEKKLKREFDGGYGGVEGEDFTAWGELWVYFPVCYDGAEWIGHAPRHPSNVSMGHQGGG